MKTCLWSKRSPRVWLATNKILAPLVYYIYMYLILSLRLFFGLCSIIIIIIIRLEILIFSVITFSDFYTGMSHIKIKLDHKQPLNDYHQSVIGSLCVRGYEGCVAERELSSPISSPPLLFSLLPSPPSRPPYWPPSWPSSRMPTRWPDWSPSPPPSWVLTDQFHQPVIAHFVSGAVRAMSGKEHSGLGAGYHSGWSPGQPGWFKRLWA